MLLFKRKKQTSKNVADATFNAINSSLLNVFRFTELEKILVIFLKLDIIPKLQILKLKLLLSAMIIIVVTMCIVGKV